MAKRKNTRSTTKTTTTRSANGRTTTTTTTRSASAPATKKAAIKPTPQPIPAEAPKKRSGWGAVAGVIVVLLLLGLLFYFLMNPILTPAQMSSQFASQLSIMQNNNQNLTAFYLANAPNYQMPTSQSWSVQVTDQSLLSSTPIGQLTISWNGQSDSLSIQSGIVNTGISPTYAVTLTHSEFMSFSQAVITRNTADALAYYSTYYLSGKLKYTRVN